MYAANCRWARGGIGFWSDYAGALAARGYVFREMGDFVAALQDYGESDRILERGISLSPGNRQPAWQLARNSLEVGRTLCLAGDVQEACRRLAKASDELREFQRDDTSDQATLRELALSLAWLGKARKQAGFADKHWRSPVEEAVRLATEAAQHDPASAKAAENLEAIQSIAGDLRVARGIPTASGANWPAALSSPKARSLRPSAFLAAQPIRRRAQVPLADTSVRDFRPHISRCRCPRAPH